RRLATAPQPVLEAPAQRAHFLARAPARTVSLALPGHTVRQHRIVRVGSLPMDGNGSQRFDPVRRWVASVGEVGGRWRHALDARHWPDLSEDPGAAADADHRLL